MRMPILAAAVFCCMTFNAGYAQTVLSPAEQELPVPVADEVIQPGEPGVPTEQMAPAPNSGSSYGNPFAVPQGLTMSVDQLLQILGHNTECRLNGVPFPFTVEMCESLAGEAFRRGLYADARAIADHGIYQEKLPSLVYIRGVAELAMGDADAALLTIRELIPIHPPTTPTQELSGRVRGPIAVRFVIAYRAVKGNSEILIEGFSVNQRRPSRHSVGNTYIARSSP